mmetsp:Transcript_33049/g.84246  ORF Transcript_33049/g.84246 Transcript_33049/m.84246 type:complete len:212 (+) Transcript_33049:118-753(+)
MGAPPKCRLLPSVRAARASSDPVAHSAPRPRPRPAACAWCEEPPERGARAPRGALARRGSGQARGGVASVRCRGAGRRGGGGAPGTDSAAAGRGGQEDLLTPHLLGERGRAEGQVRLEGGAGPALHPRVRHQVRPPPREAGGGDRPRAAQDDTAAHRSDAPLGAAGRQYLPDGQRASRCTDRPQLHVHRADAGAAQAVSGHTRRHSARRVA